MDDKDAYKFARYQGESDEAAAEFVTWFQSRTIFLNDAYKAWREEVDAAEEEDE